MNLTYKAEWYTVEERLPPADKNLKSSSVYCHVVNKKGEIEEKFYNYKTECWFPLDQFEVLKYTPILKPEPPAT